MFFASSMILLAYLFHHFFDDPDTAIKYVGLIFMIGCLITPVGLSIGLVAAFELWDSLIKLLYAGFILDPLFTFGLTTFDLCIQTIDPTWRIPMFGYDHINPYISVACLIGQVFLYFWLNIAIDYCLRNRWRKKGGPVGNLLPHLPVKQDVIQHEEEVKEDHENSDKYQIKAVDLTKTYPKMNEQAVCSNTFGVQNGEVLGLLGPNGAGKSTTFSMVSM